MKSTEEMNYDLALLFAQSCLDNLITQTTAGNIKPANKNVTWKEFWLANLQADFSQAYTYLNSHSQNNDSNKE